MRSGYLISTPFPTSNVPLARVMSGKIFSGERVLCPTGRVKDPPGILPTMHCWWEKGWKPLSTLNQLKCSKGIGSLHVHALSRIRVALSIFRRTARLRRAIVCVDLHASGPGPTKVYSFFNAGIRKPSLRALRAEDLSKILGQAQTLDERPGLLVLSVPEVPRQAAEPRGASHRPLLPEGKQQGELALGEGHLAGALGGLIHSPSFFRLP